MVLITTCYYITLHFKKSNIYYQILYVIYAASRKHAAFSRLTLNSNIYGSKPNPPDKEPQKNKKQASSNLHQMKPVLYYLLLSVIHFFRIHIVPHKSLSCHFFKCCTLLAIIAVRIYRYASRGVNFPHTSIYLGSISFIRSFIMIFTQSS